MIEQIRSQREPGYRLRHSGNGVYVSGNKQSSGMTSTSEAPGSGESWLATRMVSNAPTNILNKKSETFVSISKQTCKPVSKRLLTLSFQIGFANHMLPQMLESFLEGFGSDR